MASSLPSPSPRPKAQRRGRSTTTRKVEANNKVKKLPSQVNTSKKRAAHHKASSGLRLQHNLFEPTSPPSSSFNKQSPLYWHDTPQDPLSETLDHSLSPEDEDRLELELPPPLHELTELNLLEHTHSTNPGERLVNEDNRTSTAIAERMADRQRLERYGVKILDDNAPFPAIIRDFLVNVVSKPRTEETPGAKMLHNLQARAKDTSESQAADIIATWLMFRDESHLLVPGPRFISISHEPQFERGYVAHPTNPDFNLAQPRPDRVNGYVSYAHARGGLHSPFREEQDAIIRDYMVPILHDEAFFPWLMAEFKSALGKSIAHASLQCARNGVAACNYIVEFLAEADINATERDTIHFTIAYDADSAVLYIHWVDSAGRHNMGRVCRASLHANFFDQTKSDDMVRLRKYLHNILEWALGERLNRIKQAISIVAIRVAAEEAAAAQARAEAEQRAQSVASSRIKGGTSSATSGSRARSKARGSTRTTSSSALTLQVQGGARRSSRNKDGSKSGGGAP